MERFGGGTDKGETFIQTAVREGGEELTGFLGTNNDLKKMLHKYGTYNIDYKSQGYSTYRCHIFPMEYDPMLPHYYNNNQQFLQKHLDAKIIKNTKIFEKTQIKWFSFDDIKKHHNEFRSFYKNIIQLIIDNRLAIEKFIRTKNNKSKKYTFKKSITKNNKTKKYTSA